MAHEDNLGFAGDVRNWTRIVSDPESDLILPHETDCRRRGHSD